MVQRYRPLTASDSGRLSGACFAVRSNEFLGCHGDHQPVLRFPLFWGGLGNVTLRWVRGRQCHTHPVFHLSLFSAICGGCHCGASYFPPSCDGQQQPPRGKQRCGKNPFPLILFGQGCSRVCGDAYRSPGTRTYSPELPGGARQLHPSEPDGYTTSHRPRMILSLCVRNSAFNP